jgi:hypothetical protein
MEVRSQAMDFDEEVSPEPRPRTSTVLALLLVAAGLFAYIGAYPMTSALAGANLIPPIMPAHDPRLIWAASAFVVILSCILIAALVLRFLSRRQLKRIDTMEEA